MQLTISTNFPEVQRQLTVLQANIANKATASAANKTVAVARTAMSREIRQEFNLSAAKVREKLFIKKARLVGGELRIEAALLSQSAGGKKRSINLINFAAKQTAKGLSVKIKRKGGRKIAASSGFIGNAGRTAFIRTGEPKRLVERGFNAGRMKEPLRALQTIDVPQMFNKASIKDKVVEVMNTRFPDIWAREVAFFTQRFGGGR